MSEIYDYELLQLIHKHINLEALKSQNNSITKEAVDDLFSKLLENAKRAPAGANSSPKGLASPPLFWEDNTPQPRESLIIHTDGASRGNPGKAGIGVVIYNSDGQEVDTISEYIGEATNNVAEYKALLSAAHRAVELGAKDVVFKLDSELIVKQLHHKYSVKSPHLIPLFREMQGLLKKIQKYRVVHVRREENSRADELANLGIDSAKHL